MPRRALIAWLAAAPWTTACRTSPAAVGRACRHNSAINLNSAVAEPEKHRNQLMRKGASQLRSSWNRRPAGERAASDIRFLLSDLPSLWQLNCRIQDQGSRGIGTGPLRGAELRPPPQSLAQSPHPLPLLHPRRGVRAARSWRGPAPTRHSALTTAAATVIEQQVRCHVLHGFARHGLLDPDDARDMIALDNSDASVCIADHDRAGLKRLLLTSGMEGLEQRVEQRPSVIGRDRGRGKGLVADLAPSALRGTAFGWFNLTAGLLLLPASLLFGAIYQGAGASAAFGFSTACAFTAALLLPTWALRGTQRG
jgi:hypothetical protein